MVNLKKLYNELTTPIREYKYYLQSLKQKDKDFTDMINEYVKKTINIKPENVQIYPVGENLINKLREINKLKEMSN